MGAHSKPELDDPFDEAIDEALNSLPSDLRAEVSNVAIVVEDEPPHGRLLGLYSGLPRALRGPPYSGLAECFRPRSASFAGRSLGSLPATRIDYAARSGKSC